MGLSASQARMMLLVARKSDLEYRGQIINNRRMTIAWDSARISQTYNDAINNRVLLIKDGDAKLTVTQGVLEAKTGCLLVDKDGNQITATNYPASCYKPDPNFPNDRTKDILIPEKAAAYVEEQLRNGNWHLEVPAGSTIAGHAGGETVDWRTELPQIIDILDTSDDEPAKAKYESESKLIQVQDRELEIELKNVDTQHQAVQTEIDAVKKVIDKNIETSFKTFG